MISDEGQQLGADRLRELLSEVSTCLQERGVRAQLFVVGGAAIAMGFDERRTTRDVDAIFVPTEEVRAVVSEIAERHRLEAQWLNDAAKGFMPTIPAEPQTVYSSKNLVVQVPSAEYLLAMKLYASRGERDFEDAALLFNAVGYQTAEQGMELLARSYPASQLLPRHRYVVEDVAQRSATLRDAVDTPTKEQRRQSDSRKPRGQAIARRDPGYGRTNAPPGMQI